MINEDDQAKVILRDIAPALRDVLWCALVWNDHDYTYQDFLTKSERAAATLGMDKYNGVAAMNEWLRLVDEAMK
jgi:hypothetical protein